MDRQTFSPAGNEQPRPVKLDHHDSVRSHVYRQLSSEVQRLEGRIEALRLTDAPHAAIMISTYERMIDRKKGFMRSWAMQEKAFTDVPE